ncbi:hypothetical protein QDY65_00540 [Pyrococcus kukulkanii]|uniref:hypothetical protein n=1 Tax=Pyrococcus kukulkanii TaxID=1609559 RepID=UPI003564F753
MEATWFLEFSLDHPLDMLLELSKTGNLSEYYVSWEDGGIGLWADYTGLFNADVSLTEAMDELSLLNLYLLGEKSEVPRGRVKDDLFRRALAGDKFEMFLEEHPVVGLGSYDPMIDLHIVKEGEKLYILSLDWYGSHQEVFCEVNLDDWLETTSKLSLMVLRDFEKMLKTLKRFAVVNAQEVICKLKKDVMKVLDYYPVDVDSLPPAYAPWDVEEVCKVASKFLKLGNPEMAAEVLRTLKNENHFRWAVWRIPGDVKELERLYEFIPVKVLRTRLAYLHALEGRVDDALKFAEDDRDLHAICLALVNTSK